MAVPVKSFLQLERLRLSPCAPVREGQTPVAANAVAPSKEGLLHRTFNHFGLKVQALWPGALIRVIKLRAACLELRLRVRSLSFSRHNYLYGIIFDIVKQT